MICFLWCMFHHHLLNEKACMSNLSPVYVDTENYVRGYLDSFKRIFVCEYSVCLIITYQMNNV